jgi:hypothetical protein
MSESKNTITFHFFRAFVLGGATATAAVVFVFFDSLII